MTELGNTVDYALARAQGEKGRQYSAQEEGPMAKVLGEMSRGIIVTRDSSTSKQTAAF